jgi:hypothetical protein
MGRVIDLASIIPEAPAFVFTQSGTPSATRVVYRGDRVAAFVASLRETATILEKRIESEEAFAGLGSSSDRDCPLTVGAMRDRLRNLRATITRVLSTVS